MAKRMCDTTLYEREWFQLLPLKYKLFWEFITKKCDCAGIWEVNLRMLPYQIGAEFDEKELLEVFSERIIRIEEDKWLVKKHVKFQYGKELSEKSSIHRGVLNALSKYNLTYSDGVVIQTNGVKEVKVDKPKTKRFEKPTVEDITTYFIDKKYIDPKIEAQKMFDHYESNGWKVGRNKMESWKHAASNWNQNRKEGSFQPPKTKEREKYKEETQADQAW